MSFSRILGKWLNEFTKIVIIGIGNPLRQDDNVGMAIVKQLRTRLVDDRILFIESESVPESYIEPIVEFHPSHILIVDAAILGLSPGAIELRAPSETTQVAISTHSLPIHIFCSYLKRVTRAQIGLLLIQPQQTSFGEGLSPQVKRAVKEVVNTFHQLLT